MPPSLAGAAQDLRDELGAVDVHSDISEPDTSDDEVARATATAKRTASKDLESRMARIREQGKNKPPAKPHWTRARPEDDGPSEMSAAAAELRGAFDADYEAEEAEEASPVRRRADSPAMPRARNETQVMLEEAARLRAPRAIRPARAPDTADDPEDAVSSSTAGILAVGAVGRGIGQRNARGGVAARAARARRGGARRRGRGAAKTSRKSSRRRAVELSDGSATRDVSRDISWDPGSFAP